MTCLAFFVIHYGSHLREMLHISNTFLIFVYLNIGIIINDSSGRAWRNGIVGIAIGSSGVDVLLDLKGHKDLYGNSLEVTEVGNADEIASAASLLMGQANESFPVVVVRGFSKSNDKRNAKALLRDPSEDLFR